MVVAGDDQHAAEFGRAGGVGVTEDVAAAVDARPLAVPHAEHAVVLGAGEQPDLLAAPDGGGGEVFVDAGLEGDVVFGEMGLGLPQAEVEIAERAAAIAGNEPGGIQPGRQVAFPLQHGQADQGLGAGQEDAAGVAGVFVVQGAGQDFRQKRFAHGWSPLFAALWATAMVAAPPGVVATQPGDLSLAESERSGNGGLTRGRRRGGNAQGRKRVAWSRSWWVWPSYSAVTNLRHTRSGSPMRKPQ